MVVFKAEIVTSNHLIISVKVCVNVYSVGSKTCWYVFSDNGQMCAIKEVNVVSDDSNSRECLRQLNQVKLLLIISCS